MRLKLVLLSALLLALAGGSWWLMAPPAADTAQSKGFAAPAFNWLDFNGKSFALNDHAGKVVVLHFWASWCAPCRTEFPHLLQAVAAHPDVIFLALSSDSDRAKAEKFLQEMQATPAPANLLLGWDKDKKITYDLFMTAAYPETIFLDKQHRMRRKIPGLVEWQSPEMRDYLRELAAE